MAVPTATGAPEYRKSRVVDASVAAAVVFGDVATELNALDFDNRAFVAPSIIRYEFLHICTKKQRAGAISAEGAIEAWRLFESLEISTEYVSFPETLAAAIRYRLSGYDAAYLWLAISQQLALVTLDQQLEKAWRKAVNELTL